MSEVTSPRLTLGERIRELGPLWHHRHNLRSSVETIRRYIDSVTSLFERDRKSKEEYLLTCLKDAASDVEAESINDELNESDNYLAREFPTFALETTFVATYSLLEDQMASLARFMGQLLGIKLDLDDLSHKGITAARVYLEKLCGIPFPDGTTAWQQAVQYGRLRNVIAHARGRVKKEDSKTRNFITSKKKLLILSISDQLQLTKEFCLEVVDNVEVLLGDLFSLAEERLASPA